MKPEDKELLLKDLSARLTYGVKCNVWYGPKSPALNEKDKYTDDILETINPQKGNCTFHNAIGYDFGFFPIEHIRPYLRPMSSMTEEEAKDIGLTECLNSFFYIGVIDWLNAHHFDYRGLIEKGLALEAPEDMYKAE